MGLELDSLGSNLSTGSPGSGISEQMVISLQVRFLFVK